MMSLKDKRLSKKIISSVLIILFVMYPILQIYMNVGEVFAAGATITETSIEYSTEPNLKLKGNQTAKLKRIEHKYNVTYIGSHPNVIFVDGNNSARILCNTKYNGTKVADTYSKSNKRNRGKEKIYTAKKMTYWYEVRALVTETTGWLSNAPSTSDYITANIYTGYSGEAPVLTMYLNSYKIADTRYVFEVKTTKPYTIPGGTSLFNSQAINGLKDTLKDTDTYHSYSASVGLGSGSTGGSSSGSPKPYNSGSTGGNSSAGGNSTGGSYSSGGSASGGSASGSSSSAYQIPQSVTNRTDLTDNARRLYISNLYKRALKREPENSEIDGHFKNTTYKEAIDIILSEESNNKNKINSMTNEQFVEACYNYLLGRTSEQDGKNAWVKALSNGTTRNNLILGFVTSEEFLNKTNKETTTLTFDKTTCDSVYKVLISRGYTVVKPTDTTLLMYKSDVEGLEAIDLQGKGITNLTGLSSFTNLKILNLAHNKITDLTKLSSLTNLERLDLTNNQVTDLNGIEKLTKLKHLNLNHNKNVAKHQQIEKLTNLKVLWMNDCGLRYFTANLSGLTQLEEIYLDDNVIVGDGIMTLATGKNLKKIYIKNNQITTVASLQYLDKVEEFYVDNNQISNIGSTTNTKITSAKNNISLITTKNGEINLPTLIKSVKDANSVLYTDKDLVLTNCKIEDDKILITGDNTEASVKIVGGKADGSVVNITNDAAVLTFKDKVLAQRVNRQLANSRLEEKDGVYNIFAFKSVVDKTKYLNLSTPNDETEKIEDIAGLEQFKNLNSVNLSNNSVKWMSDTLGKMNSLETLELRECGLKELSELRTAKTLKQLDVSHNEIQDITYLSNLENLEYLLLNDNRIENNLGALNRLSNLRVLDISNNNVTSLEQISSLKLETLYANYNKISDISVIDRSEMQNLSLNNNIIDLETNENNVEIPNIINLDSDKLELNNCQINNKKVIIDGGAKTSSVIVKDGAAKDTIINIENNQAIDGPKVDIEYVPLKDGTYVKAIITADRDIIVPGWNYEETSDGKKITNKVSNVFWYNVSNQKITVKDLYNNKTETVLNYKGIISEYVPDLTVSYSDLNPTSNSVTVSVTSSEELYENTEDGWSYGQNHNTIVKTYNENNVLIFEKVWTKTNAKIPEKGYRLELSINTIDKLAPECDVEYNVLGRTKGSVNATIWANEPIELSDARKAKLVTKTDSSGNTLYGIKLNYTDNKTETLTVKDLAGNESTVNIEVTNIDKGIDGLTSSIDTNSSVSESVKVNLEANEEINIQKNITELLGNLNETNGLIFKVAADNVGNVNLNRNNSELEIDEPVMDVIEVNDLASNKELMLINTNMIDKNSSTFTMENITNDDGTVTVKITFEEPIQNTENLSDWDLNEDSTVLTKTFSRNCTEFMEVKDLADNITKFNVVVNSIGNINYSVIYEEIEDTDKILVVISADRELEELEGWTLSEDKKMLGKIIGKDEILNITFYTEDGIAEKVTIQSILDGNNISDDENNKTDEEKNDISDGKKDDSVYDKIIPNAGFRSIFIICVIIVFSIFAFRIYKKKKYRY
ncbi:MAG: leucine-rich repeat domain-containing protein [Clostridia bacterium]|nr:leucine-rich repeat domain-containing protein [Clostridia bacterium]